MKLVKWTFRTAGIMGLLIMVPLLFMEKLIVDILPPAVNHPEFYYGFVLLNIGWQILYLFLATDPVRFRPLMLPAFFAKASAPVALWLLYFADRISADWVNTTYLDGAFAILFLVAYWLTGSPKFQRENISA